MATPTLTRHILHGALGEIFVDVRAGGRASPRPAVIVVHGFKGFKDWGMFPQLAERLARAGFSAVTFNMSGSGVVASGDPVLPERFARNTYGAELADLAAVADALFDGALGVVPPASVGLVGHSRGGGIAILQTARDHRVRSLVTWAAIGTALRWDAAQRAAWRASGHLDIANARTGQVIPLLTDVLDEIEQRADTLDIERAAAEVAVPWLIMHGTADEAVAADEARSLLAASGRPSTELALLDGAGHTFGAAHPWRAPPADSAIERVIARTVDWLGASLG